MIQSKYTGEGAKGNITYFWNEKECLFQLAMLSKNCTGFQVSVCHAVTFPVGLLMACREMCWATTWTFGDLHSNSPQPDIAGQGSVDTKFHPIKSQTMLVVQSPVICALTVFQGSFYWLCANRICTFAGPDRIKCEKELLTTWWSSQWLSSS